MPKTNIPNYRLHKATGQAFVELGGRRFYLGKYGSKASREEYERKIAEYLGNGRKLAPTQTKSGITCRELSVHFLEWAEKYYVKNGEQTPTFDHCRNAVSLFVKHYGDESVNNFAPFSPTISYLEGEVSQTIPGIAENLRCSEDEVTSVFSQIDEIIERFDAGGDNQEISRAMKIGRSAVESVMADRLLHRFPTCPQGVSRGHSTLHF